MKRHSWIRLVSGAVFAIASITNVGAQTPEYGGALTVSPYYPGISALSWDPADWNWKVNADAGPYMDMLFPICISVTSVLSPSRWLCFPLACRPGN